MSLLSPQQIVDMVNKYKDHFTQVISAKKNKHLYGETYDYIKNNFKGVEFSERAYKYVYGEKHCIVCNKLLTNFRSFFIGYTSNYCSKKCQMPTILQSVKNTNQKKYGVNWSWEIPDVVNKSKNTMLERYGVTHNWAKDSPLRENGFVTNELLHGDRYWNNPEKKKKTCLERYGVESCSQLADFHEKSKKHCWKKYTLPSGKVINVQGYEPFALNLLLKTYKEEEIITTRKNMPQFWYITEDNKKHRYFPDIYIPKDNLIIETKSSWTDSLDTEIIELKKQSVLNSGFNFKKLIFNQKGELLNE